MKMEKAEIEFRAFDEQDILTASPGPGPVPTLYYFSGLGSDKNVGQYTRLRIQDDEGSDVTDTYYNSDKNGATSPYSISNGSGTSYNLSRGGVEEVTSAVLAQNGISDGSYQLSGYTFTPYQ